MDFTSSLQLAPLYNPLHSWPHPSGCSAPPHTLQWLFGHSAMTSRQPRTQPQGPDELLSHNQLLRYGVLTVGSFLHPPLELLAPSLDVPERHL
jgi:hypothetical protein